MQQWKVLHLLIVTWVRSQNRKIWHDGFMDGHDFFLGGGGWRDVVGTGGGDGCENVDGEKEQDCWILLFFF